MKKMLSLLLAALMMIALCLPAGAEGPALSSTLEFIRVLEAEGLKYSYHGTDDDGDEVITVGFDNDQGFSYNIAFFFKPHNHSCSIRAWEVIKIDPADTAAVMRVCNNLNYTYRFTRFYVDETDYTVTIAIDPVYRENGSTGDVVLEYMARLCNILDDAYPTLAPYAK